MKLSSGRTIGATWFREIVFDNRLVSAEEFLNLFIEAVKSASEGPDDLRAKWSAIDTRDKFLAVLDEHGFTLEMLKEVQKGIRQQEYDVFDVILELAYDVEPVTRAIRAERVKAALTGLTPSRRAFAEIILRNYVESGVWSLGRDELAGLLKDRYHSVNEAKVELGFGSAALINGFYADLQAKIYAA